MGSASFCLGYGNARASPLPERTPHPSRKDHESFKNPHHASPAIGGPVEALWFGGALVWRLRPVAVALGIVLALSGGALGVYLFTIAR